MGKTCKCYKHIFCLLLVLFMIFLKNTECSAAVPTPNINIQNNTVVYTINNFFKQNAKKYLDEFKKISLTIFKIFLLIGISLHGVRATLGRSDMSDILKEFCLMILFSVFCYVAIIKYEIWTDFILQIEYNVSHQILNQTPLSLEPIDLGFYFWTKALEECSFLDFLTGKAFGIFFLGLLTLFVLAIMTARLLVVLCESYLVMSIGVILLGFGSSPYTKDYAISVMKYVVSLALKLLAMHLVIAIGVTFIKAMANSTNSEGWAHGMAYIFMTSLILYVIQNSLAEAIGGLVQGAHIGGGQGMASAVGAARATAGAVVGGVTSGMAAAGVVSKAQKIAALNGYNGANSIGGEMVAVGRELWKSRQEARMDERRHGKDGLSGRMQANLADRLKATQAKKKTE